MRGTAERGLPYAFASQRPSDALALGRRRLPALLATCEGGPAAAAAAIVLGADLVSLEDRAAVRRPWSNEDLASVVGLLEPSQREREPLLCYASGPQVEAEARRRGYSLAGGDGRLKQTFDRKEVARQLFVDAGLPTVPWLAGTRMALDFSALAERLGSPFVLQADGGSAGRGTHLIHEHFDLAAICEAMPDDVRLIASPLVAGVTLNIHGVVGHEVAVSHASIQVTGVADLTDLDFGYCGNDFGAATALSSAALERARDLTLAVGTELRSRGWVGIFGLDVLLSGDALLPLEINPRFQGSSWLLAEVQQALGERPIGELHLDLVLGEGPTPYSFTPRRLAEPAGAFLILHQRHEAATLSATPTAGIYRADNSGLQFMRAGVGLLECASDEVYLEGFPPAGHTIERGAVLARLATWHRLVELDGRTLAATGSTLVHHVSELLRTGAPISV